MKNFTLISSTLLFTTLISFRLVAMELEAPEIYINAGVFTSAATATSLSNNQDRYLFADDLPSPARQQVFAIFDGHGGSCAAEVLKLKMPTILDDARTSELGPALAFKNAFAKADTFVSKIPRQGSTALMVMVNQNQFVVANAGLSQALVLNRNEDEDVLWLSTAHFPTDESEHERIIAMDGKLTKSNSTWYVDGKGKLATARTLGGLKPRGVIAEPDVTVMPLTSNTKFVVMASRDLWSTMSKQEIKESTRKYLSLATPNRVARKLAKDARAKGAKRDLTIIVISFTPTLQF